MAILVNDVHPHLSRLTHFYHYTTFSCFVLCWDVCATFYVRLKMSQSWKILGFIIGHKPNN